MPFIARFRAIGENEKAAVVRKLLESSTPDFDFFYFVVLSITMATLGLLLNNGSIVIGSMLIAPLLYPILSLSLGLVMSNQEVMSRSIVTLGRSLIYGLLASTSLAYIALNISSNAVIGDQILSRTEPSFMFFLVAIIAGAAVSYSFAQPEWNETLPGIAISVALMPPLAVMGIGIAELNFEILTGSALLLLMNVFGIVFASMVSFSLMNLYDKQNIAESTIRKEDKRMEEEIRIIKEVAEVNTTPEIDSEKQKQ